VKPTQLKQRFLQREKKKKVETGRFTQNFSRYEIVPLKKIRTGIKLISINYYYERLIYTIHFKDPL